MNSREEQLILDLASGSLPLEEVRRLEATLSEEAQRELATHRLVLGAISAESQPVMTDIEQARLHRNVAEAQSEITRELSATKIATPASRQVPKARTVRWMRFASAATVAALFIGVVAVGSQLNVGSGSDSSDTIAAAAAETSLTTDSSFAANDQEPGAPDVPAPAPISTVTTARSFAVLQAPAVEAETEEADLVDLARFITESSDVVDAVVKDLACFDVALDAVDTKPESLVKGFTLMYRNQLAVGFQSQAVDDEQAIRIYDPLTCQELATTPR